MKLKELKDSLDSRFKGADFDDTEIILQTTRPDGKTEYQILAFTATTTDLDCIILGSHTEAIKMMKKNPPKT